MELRVDHVHLAEIGLTRVTRDLPAVLDGHSEVRVAFHAESGEEPDCKLGRL